MLFMLPINFIKVLSLEKRKPSLLKRSIFLIEYDTFIASVSTISWLTIPLFRSLKITKLTHNTPVLKCHVQLTLILYHAVSFNDAYTFYKTSQIVTIYFLIFGQRKFFRCGLFLTFGQRIFFRCGLFLIFGQRIFFRCGLFLSQILRQLIWPFVVELFVLSHP